MVPRMIPVHCVGGICQHLAALATRILHHAAVRKHLIGSTDMGHCQKHFPPHAWAHWPKLVVDLDPWIVPRSAVLCTSGCLQGCL
jgi:hypothetical protein